MAPGLFAPRPRPYCRACASEVDLLPLQGQPNGPVLVCMRCGSPDVRL